MSCALTSDYSFACDTGSGGVAKDMYIIELENVDSVTESSGTLTAITNVTGKIFRKYNLVLETASFDEDMVGNIQNGTLFYDQKGSIAINKQNVAVRNEILLLAKARLAIVMQDNNNTYRYFGRANGLKLTTGKAASGVAWTDRNGYTLEFTGKENELAPFVLDAVIDTLQTPE
jgi:hypothetical protein